MKLEAVTVCIDFSKQLEKCVSNKHLFDRWVIATHETDHDTIQLCKKHNIEYVCSNRVFDKAQFAKGRAINDALKICDKADWLVHLDADVKLPSNFKQIAQKYCDNKSALYGMPRQTHNKVLSTYFHKKITNKKTQTTNKMKIGNLGAIGYFQMWHSSNKRKYVENSKTGKNDDTEFMLSFKPTKPIRSFKEHWLTLPISCTDTSGFQGHFRKHYIGIRNLKNLSK
jgi:cellulose synthase/poly-beta-1,6-N-acetylglucosamine synthase-like glycosyltransferase